MNTETTSTPPDAAPTSNIQAVDFSSEPKKLHNKIAKLPKSLRDIINSSLDDSLPAKEIIRKLEASTNPPLPYPISEVNISGWKSTGYMRYLAHLDHLQSIQVSREAALEMVASNNLSLPQATLQVIASQCFEILANFSTAAVKEKLAAEPLKYTSFLHVFARLTREMVHLEKFQEARAAAEAERAAAQSKANWFQGVDDYMLHSPNKTNPAENSDTIHPHPEPPPPPEFAPSQPTTPAPEIPEHFDTAPGARAVPARSNVDSPADLESIAAPSDPQPQSPPPAPAPEPQTVPDSVTDTQPSPQTSRADTAAIISERCLDCHHPLPPLTADGKRPDERCQNCGVLLPAPGLCTRPSNDPRCHCGTNLPARLPSGRRPRPTCHNCGAGLGRELDEDIQKFRTE